MRDHAGVEIGGVLDQKARRLIAVIGIDRGKAAGRETAGQATGVGGIVTGRAAGNIFLIDLLVGIAQFNPQVDQFGVGRIEVIAQHGGAIFGLPVDIAKAAAGGAEGVIGHVAFVGAGFGQKQADLVLIRIAKGQAAVDQPGRQVVAGRRPRHPVAVAGDAHVTVGVVAQHLQVALLERPDGRADQPIPVRGIFQRLTQAETVFALGQVAGVDRFQQKKPAKVARAIFEGAAHTPLDHGLTIQRGVGVKLGADAIQFFAALFRAADLDADLLVGAIGAGCAKAADVDPRSDGRSAVDQVHAGHAVDQFSDGGGLTVLDFLFVHNGFRGAFVNLNGAFAVDGDRGEIDGLLRHGRHRDQAGGTAHQQRAQGLHGHGVPFQFEWLSCWPGAGDFCKV